MKQNKKSIFAVVLALALTLFLMAGCMPTVRISYYEDSDLYQVGDFSYRATDIDKVYIHWYTGSVNFVESSAEILSVTESGVDLVDRAKVHWYIKDRELRIEYCASEFNDPIASGDKRLTVELPAGVHLVVNDSAADITLGTHTLGEVDIYSTSGNISAESLTVLDANIGSISGSIRMGTLISEDEVGFITTTGGIDIQDLQAKELDINSVSGSIHISHAMAQKKTDVETTSGSIHLAELSTNTIALSTASGKIYLGLDHAEKGEIKSTSGEIVVSPKEPLGLTVGYKTVSGKLTCDNCNMVNDQHVIRDGACKLQVETTSANVYIQ